MSTTPLSNMKKRIKRLSSTLKCIEERSVKKGDHLKHQIKRVNRKFD